MASERKTIVTYKGTGSQKVFAFPFDYLRKSFIKVMIDGNHLTYGTDYTVSDKQLTFTNAPVLNAIVVIYRETATDRLVAWEDASVLRAGDLTLFEVQLLHIAEETKDKVQEAGLSLDDLDGKWDARLKVLKNLLDPVDNLDAVNKRYFESTQAGYIQASQAKVDQATAQANFAQSKANDASASASAAHTSEVNAKASETNAKTSETNAKASETNAKTSETNAKASENATKTSETNAANSASQSATSASNAANSATQAYNYMQQTNNAAVYTKAEADGKFAPSGYGLGSVPPVKDSIQLHLPSGFYYTGAGTGSDWYVLNILHPSSTPDNPKFFQLTMDSVNKNFYARVVNNAGEVNTSWKRSITTGDIAILTGTIAHGGTIPLPSGFTQDQCRWMVSTYDDNPSLHTWYINGGGANMHYRFQCYAAGNRGVVCQVFHGYGGQSGTWVASTANYIIIGVK